MSKLLTLKTSDGEELVVEEAVAVKSEAIKNMVKDDCASNTIPLPNVSSKTMTKVIEYWKKHLELEEKDESKTFDKNFLKVHQSELCDLIIASNYLDDKELFDALCQEVVDRIKGKTPEEICQEFNIKYDFTPEEVEQVRRENAWAFE